MKIQRILPFLFSVLLHAAWEGQVDLGLYQSESPAPGLVQDEDGWLIQPRLTLRPMFQAGESWTVGLMARADRGVDPGREPDGEVRMDAYWLRLAPDASAFEAKAGKIPTIFGGWVPRQDSPHNAFLRPPLPYERVTAFAGSGETITREAFLTRRGQADNKQTWRPLVWAPAYAHGLMARVESGDFGFAGELRDAALSSPPEDWREPAGFGEPIAVARLDWRASPAGGLGLSLGQGQDERTLGADANYAKGRLQIWTECVGARLEVPGVGEVSSLAFSVEAKQKLDAKHFVGLRLGAQFFDTIDDGEGGRAAWDRDTWRAEVSAGRRIDRNLSARVQAAQTWEAGSSENEGHLLAMELTARF
jgi:hypothetical protein